MQMLHLALSTLLTQESANPPAAAGADAIEETMRFLEMPALWIVALILIPGAIGIAALAYWRESLTTRMRWTLVTLRALSFLLLLAVLFRPVFVRQEQSVIAPEVLFLFDDSGSMSTQDPYVGADEARSAVQALTGKAATSTTRAEIATALRSGLLQMSEAGGYVPRTFRFADEVSTLQEGTALAGRGPATAIGDAVRGAIAGHRGRYVSDIVIVSDGRSNVGAMMEDAAQSARSSGIAINTVLVGDARTEVNVSVELVDAPESVLEGDQIEIAARVSARGTEEGGTVMLSLEELSSDGASEVRLVASEEVPLVESGDRVVLVAGRDALDYGASERRFRLRVDPLEDERVTDDNVAVVTVRINREKVRVLYVEGYPRYEYRFLNAELRRMDERIDVQLYLLSADPDFQQDRTKGLSSLTRIPTSREELLDNYDVVILGDVNPYDISPDPSQGEAFVRSLTEFVERGGGLCMIAGPYDMPRAVAGTEFAQLLPVDLDRTGLLDPDTDRSFGYTLEDPAAPHEIVRLESDIEVNRTLWETKRGLKGYFWHFPVLGAKPGTQVLLRHNTIATANPGERDPLLVIGYYPSGRTMFLGIEATYRWRNRYGYRYYEAFWRNALRWLALGRMRSGDRRFELEALRSEYDISERVTLEARVLDEDYRPSDEPAQEILIEGPDGDTETLVLAGVADRPGLYRGTYQPERPGRYLARVDATDGTGQARVSAEFSVTLPSRESADPSPDPEGLAQLAAATGGIHVDLTSVEDLAEAFPKGKERREPVSSQLDDAWDRWGTLLLALGILGVEWILRKKAELV
ncbi:MAG: VWA domain-containing protein [Planctomycetota bacterium]